jgi:hypothetical protein
MYMNRRGRHAIPHRPTRQRTTSQICVRGLEFAIVLGLNTVIRHNWTIGAPVKRSLIAYDH